MNSSTQSRRAVTALGAVLLALAVAPARAEYRCNDPQGVVERRACEKALEGPDALRQFIQRTRAIYGLYFFDYAPNDPAWWKREPAPQLTAKSEPVDPKVEDGKR